MTHLRQVARPQSWKQLIDMLTKQANEAGVCPRIINGNDMKKMRTCNRARFSIGSVWCMDHGRDRMSR